MNKYRLTIYNTRFKTHPIFSTEFYAIPTRIESVAKFYSDLEDASCSYTIVELIVSPFEKTLVYTSDTRYFKQ